MTASVDSCAEIRVRAPSVALPVLAEFGGKYRKAMLGVWSGPTVSLPIPAEFGGRYRKAMLGVWSGATVA